VRPVTLSLRLGSEAGSGTAGSPRYFEPLLREVERKHFPAAYWRHLEFHIGRCEDHWQRRPDAPPGAALPKLALADPARHPGPAAAVRREGMILAAPPGIPAYHLTEAQSKRHPNGATEFSESLCTENARSRAFLLVPPRSLRKDFRKTL